MGHNHCSEEIDSYLQNTKFEASNPSLSNRGNSYCMQNGIHNGWTLSNAEESHHVQCNKYRR